MSSVIITVVVLAVIGLIIGLILVSADKAFSIETDPRESAVREALPGNNCGACGYAGCDAMAAAIVKGDAPANGCPVGGSAAAGIISAIMGVEAEAVAEKVAFVKCAGTCEKARSNAHYVGIRTCEAASVVPGKSGKACADGCFGFGSCVAVCQMDALHIVDGIAVVDPVKCHGCGLCASVCPQKLIELIPADAAVAVRCQNHSKGASVKKNCAAGCIGCGLCAKQCEHGAIVLIDNVPHIHYDKCVGCGSCVQKCPTHAIIER